MTTCGICVKANTWSYCEDMDLYAPGHVGSGRVFRSKKVKQGEIKILIVSLCFNLFALRQAEQFFPYFKLYLSLAIFGLSSV